MKADMSPRAVTRRLKITSDLRQLCIALGSARLKKLSSKAEHANEIDHADQAVEAV